MLLKVKKLCYRPREVQQAGKILIIKAADGSFPRTLHDCFEPFIVVIGVSTRKVHLIVVYGLNLIGSFLMTSGLSYLLCSKSYWVNQVQQAVRLKG